MIRDKKIYLDGAANTPVDKRVLKAMLPYMKESAVGNSFAIHDFGVKNNQAILLARTSIAKDLGFSASEVYFTSGATEGNNWIIKSLALHELEKTGKRRMHIVVSAIEHASVLESCRDLEKLGFKISYVQPNKNGMITSRAVMKVMRKDTLLVSVMAVNNETGVGNPINRIGEIAKEYRALMMSDLTQYFGYGGKGQTLSEKFPHVDYFTFSGHKLYGPLGIGCVIARKYAPLYRYMSGGLQESGQRGGTQNTPGIIGLQEAVSIWRKSNYKPLYDDLYTYLVSKVGSYAFVNVVPTHKNILSLNFSKAFNMQNLASVFACRGIACSAGSACDVSENKVIDDYRPSHVLLALKLSSRDIKNTVRISFTKYTTKKDIDRFVKIIKEELEMFAPNKENNNEI